MLKRVCTQNHSCDPNCILNPCYINEANIEKPLLAIFTRMDVAAGEELCFSYTGVDDDGDDVATSQSDDNNNVEGDVSYFQIDDSRLANGITQSSTDSERSGAVYAECRCGSAKCKGKMWK